MVLSVLTWDSQPQSRGEDCTIDGAHGMEDGQSNRASQDMVRVLVSDCGQCSFPSHIIISFKLFSRSSGQCPCQQHSRDVPKTPSEGSLPVGIFPQAVTQPDTFLPFSLQSFPLATSNRMISSLLPELLIKISFLFTDYKSNHF